MKSLLLPVVALLVCLALCLMATPAFAGGCHGVAVVQSFAVAQPVVQVQALAVPTVVYQPQFVQAQAFAVQSVPVYAQQVVQAQAIAQAGGFSRAQAIASGGFGGSSLALSRVGPPRPLRNGLAILGAAIAARRSSSLALSISR